MGPRTLVVDLPVLLHLWDACQLAPTERILDQIPRAGPGGEAVGTGSPSSLGRVGGTVGGEVNGHPGGGNAETSPRRPGRGFKDRGGGQFGTKYDHLSN